MKLGDKGKKLIQDFEQFRAKLYDTDGAGHSPSVGDTWFIAVYVMEERTKSSSRKEYPNQGVMNCFFSTWSMLPACMKRYDRAGGKILSGLTRRRLREADLFEGKVNE